MKKIIIEFKNKLLYIISLKRNIIIMVSLTSILYIYAFFSLDIYLTSNNIFLPITEDKKHLRYLESINNQTKNESKEYKNNSNLINNNSISINNANDSNNTNDEMD